MKAETDFRDLVRHPQKLFGYSFLYFLGALVLVGMLYAWNLTDIGRNSVVPLVPADSTAYITDIPLKTPSVLPPVDVMKAGLPSPALLARGSDLYRANCSSCHGETGGGDGPAGAAMNPKPRDFRTTAGWTNGSTVSRIYRTLEEGIVRNGMASYNYLPPEDRFALAHRVRSFASGHATDTPEELQALEAAYGLSAGKATAGQIPVKRAVQILVKEGSPVAGRIDTLAAQSATASGDPGALLLRHTAGDPQKVLTSFLTPGSGVPPLGTFVKVVSADPVAVGFTAAVLQLSAGEWAALHAHLLSLGPGQQGRIPQ